jgi:hypothetical protein
VRLWEAAEATVPGLRMASLHDPAPRPAPAPGAVADRFGSLAAITVLLLALIASAWLATGRRRPTEVGAAR